MIGGRQSALEIGLLLAESGAEVTIVHRHDTPDFAPSDWSWVAGDLESSERNPSWFADLRAERRSAIEERFWQEGRLRLEPWLGPRFEKIDCTIHPNTTVKNVRSDANGIRVELEGGSNDSLVVDDIICATGYEVDIRRVPYLRDLVPELECEGAFPKLNSGFESTSIPGLFISGLAASKAFGPYMGFLVSSPFAARRILSRIAA
jgi:thioredoxin reductase